MLLEPRGNFFKALNGKILWGVCVRVYAPAHARICFLWSKGSFYEMTIVGPTFVFYLLSFGLLLVPFRLSLLHHPLHYDE